MRSLSAECGRTENPLAAACNAFCGIGRQPPRKIRKCAFDGRKSDKARADQSQGFIQGAGDVDLLG